MDEIPAAPVMITAAATAKEAIRFVRGLVRHIGPGFHPDSSMDDYVDRDTGAALLTTGEAQSLQTGLNHAWRILDKAGIEIYRVALTVQRQILAGA